MSTTLSEYLGQLREGFTEGLGDLSRHAISDIGDTGQEILHGSASIAPPDNLTGTMENVTTPAHEEAMDGAQLQQLIDTQPEQQPDYSGPELG
jgi:hypothetical protein